jgi:hypothetical protein
MVGLGGTSITDTLNPLPQVWQPITKTWRNLTTAFQNGPRQFAYFYPYLYLAPNGQVFNAGPQRVTHYLNTSGTGTWADVATSTLEYRDYGSSVMYDEGKIMIVGGNLIENSYLPSASAEVIDLNDDAPTWRTVEPMQFGRRYLNTTLLPDGQVLASGIPRPNNGVPWPLRVATEDTILLLYFYRMVEF